MLDAVLPPLRLVVGARAAALVVPSCMSDAKGLLLAAGRWVGCEDDAPASACTAPHIAQMSLLAA